MPYHSLLYVANRSSEGTSWSLRSLPPPYLSMRASILWRGAHRHDVRHGAVDDPDDIGRLVRLRLRHELRDVLGKGHRLQLDRDPRVLGLELLDDPLEGGARRLLGELPVEQTQRHRGARRRERPATRSPPFQAHEEVSSPVVIRRIAHLL